jgi:predicted GH43/DUF377 family glycosyl hydrolase
MPRSHRWLPLLFAALFWTSCADEATDDDTWDDDDFTEGDDDDATPGDDDDATPGDDDDATPGDDDDATPGDDDDATPGDDDDATPGDDDDATPGDDDDATPGDDDDDDTVGVDADGDGWTVAAGDCDDNDDTVHPTAPELCDGLDNDCDGAIPNIEVDHDGDGYATCEGDCDDNNIDVHPAANEECDGLDTNCDGAWGFGEVDGDADGVWLCAGDCDDFDATVYPGAPELCDGLDNDCDGLLPEDEIDADGDGFTGCGGDCDDGDANLYPGAAEACDGLDNDCDGVVPADEADGDGDGVMVCDGDCDDADATAYPGAPELCDGADNDCDGTTPADEADADADGVRVCDGDCDDADATVHPSAAEICDGLDNNCNGVVPADETDDDGDGAMACAGDCDDEDATVFPMAPELCDGLDNDCDGAVPADEVDGDGDGIMVCDGDCDDADAGAFPGAVEACDGLDNDCDGIVPAGEVDADGDGVMICDGDCDDADAAVLGWVAEDSGFMRSDCNPVLSYGTSGLWDDYAVAPGGVVFDGTQYRMYYTGYDGSRWRIGAATSDDLLNWTKYASNPVLDLGASGDWDDDHVGWVDVDRDGSDWTMWYSGSGGTNYQIGVATSSDGYAWTRDANNPAVALGGSGEWDDYHVYYPTVGEYDGEYHMWYTGAPSSSGDYRVGHATSADGATWTKDPDNYYLSPDLSDESNVFALPSMWETDGQLYMMVRRHTTTSARFRALTSTDGLNWMRTPSSTSFDRGISGAWDDSRINTPTAHAAEDGVYLFYLGAPTNSTADSEIGVAFNRTPTATITAPADGAVYDQGDLVTVDVAVSDHAFVDNLDVRLESDLQGVIAHTNPSVLGTLSVDTADLAPGEHTLTLTVIDEGGLEATDEVTVQIEAWDCINDPTGVPDHDGDGYTVCEGDCDDLDSSVGGWDRTTSGWMRSPCNPLLTEMASESFADDRVYASTPIWDGDVYRMWFSAYDGSDWRIGYAHSPDGLHWAVPHEGATVRYWPAVALDLGDSGEWDDEGQWDTSPVDDGSGDLALYHSGYDSSHWRIGQCTSADWQELTPDPASPVLDLGASGEFDDYHVYSPAVIHDGATYHMWYGGRPSSTGTIRVGYATSSDGVNWTRVTGTYVLNVTSGEWDDTHVYNPSVVGIDTGYLMAYQGHTGAYNKVGLAYSSDGVNWFKSESNPLPMGASGEWDDYHNRDPSLDWDGVDLRLWYSGCSSSSCSGADIGVMLNRWPTAQITAPAEGTSYPAGTPVTFTAESDDYAALDTLAVVWTDTFGTELDTHGPDAFGDISFTTATLSVGTHEITLTVTDEGGLYAVDTVEVVIY